MPSSGANPTAVTDGGGALAWSNPANAKVADASYAVASQSGTGTTNVLASAGYGFAIPGGSTITGFAITITRGASAGTVVDSSLTIGGTGPSPPSGSAANRADTSTHWPVSPASASYGGPTDLWGYSGVTPAWVNDSSFGASLAASFLTGATADVDAFAITVYYTTGGGGGVASQAAAILATTF